MNVLDVSAILGRKRKRKEEEKKRTQLIEAHTSPLTKIMKLPSSEQKCSSWDARTFMACWFEEYQGRSCIRGGSDDLRRRREPGEDDSFYLG
ncbi:hypothetical protein Cob_v012748 [Colletotrichum orbiculare MAFF 240422]|uniref:Uncharacterized protein n=1 Tax=Colletotrichum orbiculare (strain 104-T / ATCC 96160 / CBS 514.97 / LARS 414 / MAFF 240422) TaxID=1213857 RepID=A0A484F935_COLOR|nr:hypothetical protein Cob_v012748 [Colletotrichum orbiculare MAFF 240422]